jgi:hypothetical protein
MKEADARRHVERKQVAIIVVGQRSPTPEKDTGRHA